MAKNDKPLGKDLGWKLTNTRYLYQSQWADVRQDELVFPGGEPGVYTYVEQAGGVFILPITPDGKLIVIRHYRYTIDQWCWEVPAGHLGDRREVPLEKVISQELREEIGAEAKGFVRLGEFFMNPGSLSNKSFFVMTTDTEIKHAPRHDPGETIDGVKTLTYEQAREWIKVGKIATSGSVLAILLAEPFLKINDKNI